MSVDNARERVAHLLMNLCDEEFFKDIDWDSLRYQGFDAEKLKKILSSCEKNVITFQTDMAILIATFLCHGTNLKNIYRYCVKEFVQIFKPLVEKYRIVNTGISSSLDRITLSRIVNCYPALMMKVISLPTTIVRQPKLSKQLDNLLVKSFRNPLSAVFILDTITGGAALLIAHFLFTYLFDRMINPKKPTGVAYIYQMHQLTFKSSTMDNPLRMIGSKETNLICKDAQGNFYYPGWADLNINDVCKAVTAATGFNYLQPYKSITSGMSNVDIVRKFDIGEITFTPNMVVTTSEVLRSQELRCEESSSQKLRFEKSSSQELCSAESSFQELRSKESSSQELGSEELSSQELRSEGSRSGEPLSEEPHSEEPRSEESRTHDLRFEESHSEESRSEESRLEESRSEESSSRELRS